jgi:integrase
VHYRVGNKLVQETLGTHAQNPSVAEARERARASMAMAAKGQNPVEVRAEEHRQEEQEKTVTKAVADYLKHVEKTTRPKTSAEVRRIFERDVLPRWGTVPLKQISKQHVNNLIDAKANTRDRPRRGFEKRGAGAQANRTLAWLRHFFHWAQSMDLVDSDPSQGVIKRAREVQRDRVLSDEELVRFWGACDRLGGAYGPLFKFLLLTAQRKEEVAGSVWSEIKLPKQLWTIPPTRSKNGKAHDVHLAPLVMQILENQPRLTGTDFVFTSGRTPRLNGFAKAKERLDKLAEIDAHWTLHDLRRTATTGMARLGVRAEVADAVLNHQSGIVRGVARIYNRFTYEPERRAALEAWSRYVETVVHPERTDNVVALRG